jgi:hypothetical protein
MVDDIHGVLGLCRHIQYKDGCPLSGIMKGDVIGHRIHIVHHPHDGSVSALAERETEILRGGVAAYELVNRFGGYFFKTGRVDNMEDGEEDRRSFICVELSKILLIKIKRLNEIHIIINAITLPLSSLLSLPSAEKFFNSMFPAWDR